MKHSREQGKRDAARMLQNGATTPESRQKIAASARSIQSTYPTTCPEYEYWGGYYTVVSTATGK
jgi:hypothetical protein